MKIICPECYFRYEFCDQAIIRLGGLNYIWCYRCDHLMSVVNNVEIRVFGDGKEVKPWFPKEVTNDTNIQ